ncbi:M48 family metallopeptidase [Hamadaea tsunoensis]|uniref:M48 family metallopeptidase n=1 Tax=Hamadaea tsunoensis TaxID=53368 RepID=UPI000429D46B|nr:M48 family metallopeptidase [Hamadaea tsunoensis]
MDFFARQQRVRRMSARLVLLFVAAVIGIVLVVDIVAVVAFRAYDDPAQLAGTAVTVSVLTAAAIGLASLFRTASLRGGGGKVALELGGVLVPQDTTDPQLRRLRNVVEEIAIASGVAVPEVYLLPNEDGINAFAAGWSPSDAAVAVTRGTLERLNRDELQGVIAHEFSHVVNGDMRLNIRLMGLLFGILFLTVVGRWMLQFGFLSGGNRNRDNKDGGGNPLPFIGIALLVAGFIGVIAGQIIQASVSRQREYLADASAVQFTRQTAGIAGALKKIAGLTEGSQIKSARRDEVGHMLFGSGHKASSLFATHPPLLDRIKVLEPSFDPGQLDNLSRQWAASPPSGLAEDVALGFASAPAQPVPAQPRPVRVDSAGVVGQIAAPTNEAYQRASEILGEIPDAVLDRARSTATAAPVLLGLMLAADPEARAAQHAVLAQHAGQRLAEAAWHEGGVLAALDPQLRLPLAQIAFPALRGLPREQQEAFLQNVFAMIHADGRITAFEYCLSRLLLSDLQDAVRPKSQWRMGSRSIAESVPAVSTLLAVLAAEGASSAEDASAAYAAGAAVALPGQPAAYTPPRGVVELEAVWDRLDALAPAEKSLVVQAAVAVIGQDGRLTVAESELLRTVCSLLHAPLPPLTALSPS